MPGPIRHRTRPAGNISPPAGSDIPSGDRLAVEPGDSANRLPSADDTAGYEIGYGKPPRHSRFAAGASGNPRGRPKGSRSLAEHLRRELDQPVTIRENGRERKMAKLEVIAKQVAKKAMTGDLKSIAFIARIEAERLEAGGSAEQLPIDAGTLAPERAESILADYLALHGQGQRDPDDRSPEPVRDDL